MIFPYCPELFIPVTKLSILFSSGPRLSTTISFGQQLSMTISFGQQLSMLFIYTVHSILMLFSYGLLLSCYSASVHSINFSQLQTKASPAILLKLTVIQLQNGPQLWFTASHFIKWQVINVFMLFRTFHDDDLWSKTQNHSKTRPHVLQNVWNLAHYIAAADPWPPRLAPDIGIWPYPTIPHSPLRSPTQPSPLPPTLPSCPPPASPVGNKQDRAT